MKATRENFWSHGSEHGHQTVRLPVKIVEVDVGIVPVFDWINSKLETFSLWSCQGEPKWFCDDMKCETVVYAYVAFLCRDQEALDQIRQCSEGFAAKFPMAEIMLEFENGMHNLWLHPDYLSKFIEHIKEYEVHEHESV